MEQLTEFVLNNLLLFAALIVVLVLLIKAEYSHQTSKGLLISPASAVRLINNHDDALIIDTRTAAEYKSGHIKGAKNIPVGEFAANLERYADYKDKPVLLYCNSGNTATRAVKLLMKAGYVKINNLEGGVMAWKEASLPLTTKQG